MPVDIISYQFAWARRPETAVATFGASLKGKKIAAVDNYDGTVHKHMVDKGFYLRGLIYFGAINGDVVLVFVYDDRGVIIGSDKPETVGAVRDEIKAVEAESPSAPATPEITLW